MKSIIKALRYGNAKTKFYIIFTFSLCLCGGTSVFFSFYNRSALWAIVAVCFILFTIFIIRSLTFYDVDSEMDNESELENKERTELQGKLERLREVFPKEKAKQLNISKKNASKIEMNQRIIKGFDTDRNLKKKNKNESYDMLERMESEETDKNDEYLKQYSEPNVKKIVISYKMKKKYIPIMIDHSMSERIKQRPAYAWLDKKSLHLLVFDSDVKKVEIPRKSITKIKLDQGVTVNYKNEYEHMLQPSFLGAEFLGLLPTYYEDRVGGRNTFKKNLYVITPDIKVTNTSVRALFDLLQVDLSILEEEIYTIKYSQYFTSAYKLNILLKDGVLSVKEYKTKMKVVLHKLAEEDISMKQFDLYINQLVQGRLITQEYAEYYVEYRQKHGMK